MSAGSKLLKSVVVSSTEIEPGLYAPYIEFYQAGLFCWGQLDPTASSNRRLHKVLKNMAVLYIEDYHGFPAIEYYSWDYDQGMQPNIADPNAYDLPPYDDWTSGYSSTPNF